MQTTHTPHEILEILAQPSPGTFHYIRASVTEAGTLHTIHRDFKCVASTPAQIRKAFPKLEKQANEFNSRVEGRNTHVMSRIILATSIDKFLA